MPDELVFRGVMAGALVLSLLTRSSQVKQGAVARQPCSWCEYVIAVVFGGWAISLVGYTLDVSWFRYPLPLPEWVRWCGAVLGAICLGLSWWVNRTLGEYFSRRLEIVEHHELVRHGPYRHVRHPRYAVFFLSAAAAALVSANLLVFVSGLAASLLLIPRIRQEEQMLARHFGERYYAYKAATGSLFPKRVR